MVHLAGVSRVIHPNDWMLTPGQDDWYFRCGESGLTCLRKALGCAAMSFEVRTNSILDLPSGYGRVLRFLRVAYPGASITACEIVKQAVDFCVDEFGARGVYSAKDPRDIDDSQTYDLIWCGSLLTHLPAEMWVPWLAYFHDHLTEGGSLVFTAHGKGFAEGLFPAFMPEPFAELQVEYRQAGFAFRPGGNFDDVGTGISLSSPSWVIDRLDELPNLRITAFMERGWIDVQDVWCVTRVPEARAQADRRRAAAVLKATNSHQ